MTRIAFATCTGYPHLHPDDQPLLKKLADQGVNAVPVSWDAPGIDWHAFDCVVLRSTWDYTSRLPEFLRWLDSLPSPTENPVETVRWNTDKRYLEILRDAGVSVVPTIFVPPGEAADTLPNASECVVKPSVSAGSQDTLRLRTDDAEGIAAHVSRIHAQGKTAMLQPYLPGVGEDGETALLYFNGVYSHAARKGAILKSVGVLATKALFAEETVAAREPKPAELALAEQTLAALPFETPLYARIDLIPGADGAPVLLELELVEPSLFFHTAAGSHERFIDTLVARLAEHSP